VFQEYTYEVVRKFNEEKRAKAQLRRRLLESTSDGYVAYPSRDAEVVELTFGDECEHSESIGA